MATRLEGIVYESGEYYVARVAKGFDVYRQGVVAATRVAQCGYTGQRGLDWCKAEIARRMKGGSMGNSDERQTMHEFVRRHILGMDSKRDYNFVSKGKHDAWNDSASHWKVTIRAPGGKSLTTSYHMGSAHKGEPEVADVLNSLSMDAASALNARDAYDLARDLGYPLETSQDKLAVRNLYSACQAIHRKLIALLGEELTDELMNDTEPL